MTARGTLGNLALALLVALATPGVFLFSVSPAAAVEPSEMLKDPVLEARARDISSGLRCLVCQNESIDESTAELARDLRLLVRERLTIGDTDAEVLQYMVDRYGEFVLLNPRWSPSTIALWVAPPALLIVGGLVVFGVFRGRRRASEVGLSEQEEARLASLMAADAEEQT